MADVLVIGGGVIGLSIAWELAEQGMAVSLLEQGQPGREASWAGAGMLPPGLAESSPLPEPRLRSFSHRLWSEWAVRLTALTGREIGYLRCGALQVRLGSAPATLDAEISNWRAEGVSVTPLLPQDLRGEYLALSPNITAAYWLPEFGQVRNPWLLQGLTDACTRRGVDIRCGVTVHELLTTGNRVTGVQTSTGRVAATRVVIAGGAWSTPLLEQAGVQHPIEPIRGQMVLFRCTTRPFPCVVEEGLRYLVPRGDGRVLAGSTEERAGFDKRTTPQAISDLQSFALRLCPALADAAVEQTWAGLRPWSAKGLPVIGRSPRFDHVFVAAGHFRSGLQMSPATAVLIREVLQGQSPSISLAELAPSFDPHAR